MSRPPFDPDRAAGGLPPPGDRAELGPARRERKRLANINPTQQLTVSQVTELIRTTLEERIASPLRVVGEISNLSFKNHCYFSLKDESNVLCCVAWATAARRFGFEPRDSQEVVATGYISHYGPQGRTQMMVNELAPVGAGALELRFRALCDELRRLGYFDEARKKPMPVFPRRIAVITSAGGAALQDVINTAAQRCKAVSLLIIDTRVQGDGAAQQVARAIRFVDRHHRRMGIDAMLVTRGGGSIEDLWAFNERIVADAVFKCTVPVVAAIGHESDTTIIELVADLRASTPTQAAMRLIPSATELRRHLDHIVHRIGSMTARSHEREAQRVRRVAGDLKRIALADLSNRRARVTDLRHRLAELHPAAQLAGRRARLSIAFDRLNHGIARRIDHRPRLRLLAAALNRVGLAAIHVRRRHLEGVERTLAAIDPQRVLGRGYSITTLADGTLVRSVKQVEPAAALVTRVSDGAIESVVGTVGPRPGAAAVAGKRRNRKVGDRADQMDLFTLTR